uniref:Uncharacterized protein n=1 Tax=Arundo donax TaxID=35708 RepID=A0A0A9HI58_ARUDO
MCTASINQVQLPPQYNASSNGILLRQASDSSNSISCMIYYNSNLSTSRSCDKRGI